jgi:hypothetical protein
MVNRCVLIVKPKQPFLRWVKSLPDPGTITLERLRDDTTAYLLPEYEADQDRDALLSEFYDEIFEEQLRGWWTDETTYPANRTLQKFREWFDVEFHSMVFDLGDYDLETEPV